jgi:DnaJ-class molecular chaperone
VTTDELITVTCKPCGGEGYRYRHSLASRKGLCDDCDGTGEVEWLPDEDKQ